MASESDRSVDPRAGLRGFLALDAFVRLLLWAGAFTFSTGAMTYFGGWPKTPAVGASFSAAWQWAVALVQWIVWFNVTYVGLILVGRLPIPTPREGRYTIAPGQKIDRQLLWSCLLATLTKARYEAPFPAFLAYHIANLPPLCWLFTPIFGPHSRSCCVTDALFMDPSLTEIGRNVTIGYDAIIAAHTQGRDEVVIKRTIIEDDVLIGGRACIYGGCHIRRGAIILGNAILRPDTIVGENEVWGGVPAKKIKELPAYGTPLPAAIEA